MAALLLRLLYNLFPQTDWGFVFVDDFCWLLRLPTGPQFTAALLSTLVALGTPLSWKKTHLAEINTWLGFVIHPAIPRVQMAAPKHIKVMELLEELANGAPMSAKAIEKAMGRILWPPDQVHAPAPMGMEDGGPDHGPPAQGGPHAGLLAEGAPLSDTHPSCRSPHGGDAATPVLRRLGKPMLAGARPPEPHQGNRPLVSLCHYSGCTPLGIQGWRPTEAHRGFGFTSLQALGGPPGRVRLPVGSDNSVGSESHY